MCHLDMNNIFFLQNVRSTLNVHIYIYITLHYFSSSIIVGGRFFLRDPRPFAINGDSNWKTRCNNKIQSITER